MRGDVTREGDEPDKAYKLDYLDHRRFIGALGVALPLLLAAGCWLGSEPLPASISASYRASYPPLRDVLVGVLFALGAFLVSYRGYAGLDRAASRLAGGFALGVAMFPTGSGGVVSALHFVSAAGFFLSVAWISFFEFTRSRVGAAPTPQKLLRNRVYRVCAGVIVALLVLIGGYMAVWGDRGPLADLRPVFVLESFAIWAFGLSWIVKGEALLRDES